MATRSRQQQSTSPERPISQKSNKSQEAQVEGSMEGPMESTDPSRHRTAQVILATLSAVVLLGMVVAAGGSGSGGSSGSDSSSSNLLRSTKAGETPFTEMITNRNTAFGLSSALQTAGSSQQEEKIDFGECTVLPPVVPTHTVTPTYTANYPGSGDDKLYTLIEAITGIVTGDDFQSNGHKNTVTINTHFPCPEGREVRDRDAPRSILLIRNPLDAISSHFEYMYAADAKAQGRELDPNQKKAPLEAWEGWRDEYFAGQLQVWHKHTEYWMEIYPTNFNRLIVSYEKLVDEKTGPKTTARIAEFLSRADGVGKMLRSSEDLPCLWHKTVPPDGQVTALGGAEGVGGGRRRLQESTATVPVPVDDHQQQHNKNTSTSAGAAAELTYYDGEAPFRGSQLRDVMMVLSQLLEKYRSDKTFAPVLVGYMDELDRRVQKQLETDGRLQFLEISKTEAQLVDGRTFVGKIGAKKQS